MFQHSHHFPCIRPYLTPPHSLIPSQNPAAGPGGICYMAARGNISRNEETTAPSCLHLATAVWVTNWRHDQPWISSSNFRLSTRNLSSTLSSPTFESGALSFVSESRRHSHLSASSAILQAVPDREPLYHIIAVASANFHSVNTTSVLLVDRCAGNRWSTAGTCCIIPRRAKGTWSVILL